MQRIMKRIITTIAVIAISLIAFAQNNNTNMNITKEWDKTFPKSEKVSHEKVSFKNRFGITLVADMYKPRKANCEPLPLADLSEP